MQEARACTVYNYTSHTLTNCTVWAVVHGCELCKVPGTHALECKVKASRVKPTRGVTFVTKHSMHKDAQHDVRLFCSGHVFVLHRSCEKQQFSGTG